MPFYNKNKQTSVSGFIMTSLCTLQKTDYFPNVISHVRDNKALVNAAVILEKYSSIFSSMLNIGIFSRNLCKTTRKHTCIVYSVTN